MKKIILDQVFDAKTDFMYRVFVDAKLQTEILGSPVRISNKAGGSFTTGDGYITGKMIALVKNKRVFQLWRTTDFSDDDADSLVNIMLTPVGPKKTKLVLTHAGLPAGTEAEYKKGWREYYFRPIKKCLAENRE